MPIRVNDFVIQAKVDDAACGGGDGGGSSSSGGDSSSSSCSGAGDMSRFKAEILEECMELIEEFIRKKEGR